MRSLISLPDIAPPSRRAPEMVDLEDYVSDLQRRIAAEKIALAPLESGEVRLGEKFYGAVRFTDITPRVIRQHKETISQYETLLQKLRADGKSQHALARKAR